MSFLDLFKKKEETLKKESINLSFQELKNKIINEISAKESIKNYSKEIEFINSKINILKECIKSLEEKEPKSEYNKAMLIGINNARKALCNTINSGLSIKKSNNLTEFNEYLIEINKLIINSHNALSKYSHAVNIAYNNEISSLADTLQELNEAYNKTINSIKKEVESIIKLNRIKDLIKNNESINNDEINLRNELEINNKIIKENNEKISEILNELKKIDSSNELKESLINQERINELKKELSSINYRSDLIISYLSKALKRFTHDLENKFINLLLNEPLRAIKENENEYNKIKEILLKELKNKNIELKQKEKALLALESDELKNLSKEHYRINNEIIKLDISLISKKTELENNNKELMAENERILEKEKEINERIKSLNKMKKDALETIKNQASETLNTEIIISQ